MPLATAFAAVSSSGVRASDGVSAACDERNGVVAIVAAIDRRVDDHGVGVGEDADRRSADEDDASDVGQKEDALAWVPIAEHSGERSDERCRDEPRKEHEADGLLSADSVGIHRDGDEKRVLADDGCRPRELQPAEVGVTPDRGESAERVLEPPADSTHGVQHLTGHC